MHDVQILIPRPSMLYPNIFVSIRFPLDPKTGLFYDDEEKVQCDISPYGWKVFHGSDAPSNLVNKDIVSGNESFNFNSMVKITMGDAKATVGGKGAEGDFSLPTYTSHLRVWGKVYYTGVNWGRVEIKA